MIPFDPTDKTHKDAGRDWLIKNASFTQTEPLLEAVRDKWFTRATKATFKRHYNRFVNSYPFEAQKISKFRPDGVGPGEMIAWFLFDNVTLGGRNGDIDVLVNNRPFAEFKAGQLHKTHNSVDNFKITKDGDPSVGQIMQDLYSWANAYEEMSGMKMRTSSISAKFLEANLNQKIQLPKLSHVPVMVHKESLSICDLDGEVISSIWEVDLRDRIEGFVRNFPDPAVDNSISTFKKIVARWRKQAFKDSVQGKNFAVVNKDNLMMMYFGQLTEGNIGLYRIHRNQPWARIYLPSARAT